MSEVTLVQPYNTQWPYWFESVKAFVEPALAGVQYTIEHVGSTAVLGMTAKPIIDIDVIVERPVLSQVIDRLAAIGYTHLGDLGILDREAFTLQDQKLIESLPPHHFYVCIASAASLRDHICFRNFMRTHPEWVDRLSQHKLELCKQFDNDRQSYIDGKSDMVCEITTLAMMGK
ncbi:GrpB family protein [bacterium]|nr:GrpB family protein [bacterium]